MPQEQTVYKAFEFTPNTTNVPSTMGNMAEMFLLQFHNLISQFTITTQTTQTPTMIRRQTPPTPLPKKAAQSSTRKFRQKYAILN